MIDGIVGRVVEQLGPQTKVIATGGQGGVVTKASRFVTIYDEDLTLEGLRLIWERSRVSSNKA
jgi:type III pantothenate kinase